MAQTTKFTIDANLSGIQLRTQASEMLTALSTLNSGNLEPANPSAGMLWLDTTRNILKIRDKTNTAWLDFAGVKDKVVAASAADSAKLGGVAADKYAKKDDIPAAPKAATETEAGIVKLKNSITGSLADTAVSEKAAKEYVDKNASIGIGQTWQDVTAQRQYGVVYTNTTGRPIMVYIKTVGGSGVIVSLEVNGIEVATGGYAQGIGQDGINVIVPPNATYKLTGNGTGFGKWAELR